MRVWVLMVAVVVAGCADPPAPEDDEDIGLDEDLRATAETGVIRGVVVDPAIVPIAGVTIEVQGGPSTVTNADGAFGFQDLQPGSYFLKASKAGFGATQASVDVVAGIDRPPVTKIMMDPDPTTTPFVVPHYFKGHMGCSLSYIALCGLPVVNDLTDDSFLAEFDVDRPPQWVNLEAVWDGTQPTGDQMNLNMGGTPAGPATTCCTAQGPSPLLAAADEQMLANYSIGSGENLIGRLFAWEMEGTGIDDHTGQCVPVVLTTYCQGPGMALQQDFEFFVHVFYNWVPEEGWRFTQNVDPVPPR